MNVWRSTGTSNVACDINGIPTPIMQRVIELSDTPSFKRYICIVPLHWTTYKKNSLHFQAFVKYFLTHLWPMYPFYTTRKHQKTKHFLVFSVGVKWEHWPEIGWAENLIIQIDCFQNGWKLSLSRETIWGIFWTQTNIYEQLNVVISAKTPLYDFYALFSV